MSGGDHGVHMSFQSLATTVLFSAIIVFLVMLCLQTNKLLDDNDDVDESNEN